MGRNLNLDTIITFLYFKGAEMGRTLYGIVGSGVRGIEKQPPPAGQGANLIGKYFLCCQHFFGAIFLLKSHAKQGNLITVIKGITSQKPSKQNTC